MILSYLLPITQETGIRLTDTSCAIKYLDRTINSVINQSIPNWELIVIAQLCLVKEVQQIINEQITRVTESPPSLLKKIKVISTKSSNAAIACNTGLEKTSGKFVAVIQPGDMLALHATYELIKYTFEYPKAQFIYTDHDHVDFNGQRFKPFYKPDLSPDLLYCQNYINNLVLIKKTLLTKLGGWNARYGYAYGYALNLNAIGNLIRLDRPNPELLGHQTLIKHLSQILYHERVKKKIDPRKNKLIELKSNKVDQEKQSKQGLLVIRQFLKDQDRNAAVKQIKTKLYRHYWKIPKPEPLVSIIIPTRDGYDILKTCVQSILKKTAYTNYEILIIDNQSSETKAIKYMRSLAKEHKNIWILKYNKPFNYSAINNYAVTQAKGEILGFINNDTEVLTPNWLTEMVSHAARPEIGCVGALLYYPDGYIQHAGIVIDKNNLIDHAFKGLKRKKENDYFNYLYSTSNPKAVTAAALLVKKELFNKVNGFDEKNLKIAFNDVDLCLNLLKSGFFNLFTPEAQLIHYESLSRNHSQDSSEYKKLIAKNKIFLKHGMRI